MMGARVIEVPMVDWTHDLETMAKACSSHAKIVFVANPNNPTGTYNSVDEVRKLLRSVSSKTLVVLDEAYAQYAAPWPEYPESIPELVDEFENLVVLRTFSKVYGLAGLRVGYAVGSPEVLSWMDRIRMPFNVNLPAQQACIEALKDTIFVKKSVALVDAGRETLVTGLRDLGFQPQESATNFVFARSPIPGRELFRQLLKTGIIIRPLDEYHLPDHVRITIGSKAENKAVLLALKKILATLSIVA